MATNLVPQPSLEETPTTWFFPFGETYSTRTDTLGAQDGRWALRMERDGFSTGVASPWDAGGGEDFVPNSKYSMEFYGKRLSGTGSMQVFTNLDAAAPTSFESGLIVGTGDNGDENHYVLNNELVKKETDIYGYADWTYFIFPFATASDIDHAMTIIAIGFTGDCVWLFDNFWLSQEARGKTLLTPENSQDKDYNFKRSEIDTFHGTMHNETKIVRDYELRLRRRDDTDRLSRDDYNWIVRSELPEEQP